MHYLHFIVFFVLGVITMYFAVLTSIRTVKAFKQKQFCDTFVFFLAAFFLIAIGDAFNAAGVIHLFEPNTETIKRYALATGIIISFAVFSAISYLEWKKAKELEQENIEE